MWTARNYGRSMSAYSIQVPREDLHGVYDLSLFLLITSGVVLFLPESKEHVAFACVPYSDQAFLSSGVESELPRPRGCAREIFVWVE